MTIDERRRAVYDAAVAYEATRDVSTRDAVFAAVQAAKRPGFQVGAELQGRGFEILQSNGERERVVGFAENQQLADQIITKLNAP